MTETEVSYSDDLVYVATNSFLRKFNSSSNSYPSIWSTGGSNRRILNKDTIIMLISQSSSSGQIVTKIERVD